MRGSRTVWLVSSLAVVVLVVALLYWRQQREQPALRPIAKTPLAVRTAPFKPWMRFEPSAEHRDLYARLYVDLLLGHQVFRMPPSGLPPRRAGLLLLDDDDLLLSSGRRLWNREALPRPGMVGRYCFIHSNFCLRRLFETYFIIDGEPAVIYDDLYSIERFPSRTVIHYMLGPLQIDEHKYLTYDDRAVCSYEIRARDAKPHDVIVQVVTENLTMPRATGITEYPLLGSGRYQEQPLYVYLDAPEFEALEAYPIHLGRKVAVPANGTAPRVNVAVSFENSERTRTAEALPSDLLEQHVVDYQQWFFDNVPYLDCPDARLKKMWYYRWWIVRLHLTEPGTPDLKGFTFYEGKLGFDNLISFAVPAQLKELTYLRDSRFGLDQARNSYSNLSAVGAVVDAPSSPYWGEMYSQWIARALAEFNRVHPLDAATVRALLPAMARDVRAWLEAFDPDNDFLPSRDIPRITGYDLDVLSWWYFSGLKLDLANKPPDLERVDFASFVYANATGIVELADFVGDRELAQEFSAIADNIRQAVLDKLWDPETAFFYPQRASDDTRIPIRELHGFFPFTMLLAPDEPAYQAAWHKFIDPREFWARFPPVITSTAHYRAWSWGMDGLTRNIAPHPISMGGLTLVRALHDYQQDVVKPAHFMELMARYTRLMYPGVHPNDPAWRPNAHEYYSKWEPGSASMLPKPSDISHDFHSMYNALVVEGVIGLTPRTDEQIELRPAAHDWAYFVLDRLRYRGHDLTIVWDLPDGKVRYPGYPEGLSLYIDGEIAFTRGSLDPVRYDPATRSAVDLGVTPSAG